MLNKSYLEGVIMNIFRLLTGIIVLSMQALYGMHEGTTGTTGTTVTRTEATIIRRVGAKVSEADKSIMQPCKDKRDSIKDGEIVVVNRSSGELQYAQAFLRKDGLKIQIIDGGRLYTRSWSDYSLIYSLPDAIPVLVGDGKEAKPVVATITAPAPVVVPAPTPATASRGIFVKQDRDGFSVVFATSYDMLKDYSRASFEKYKKNIPTSTKSLEAWESEAFEFMVKMFKNQGAIDGFKKLLNLVYNAKQDQKTAYNPRRTAWGLTESLTSYCGTFDTCFDLLIAAYFLNIVELKIVAVMYMQQVFPREFADCFRDAPVSPVLWFILREMGFQSNKATEEDLAYWQEHGFLSEEHASAWAKQA